MDRGGNEDRHIRARRVLRIVGPVALNGGPAGRAVGCPACGAGSEADVRFCDQCGAELTSS